MLTTVKSCKIVFLEGTSYLPSIRTLLLFVVLFSYSVLHYRRMDIRRHIMNANSRSMAIIGILVFFTFFILLLLVNK